MFALLSLVVCLAAQPVVCETVTPDHVYSDTGRSPTFFECLGPVGQDIARHWLAEESQLSPAPGSMFGRHRFGAPA